MLFFMLGKNIYVIYLRTWHICAMFSNKTGDPRTCVTFICGDPRTCIIFIPAWGSNCRGIRGFPAIKTTMIRQGAYVLRSEHEDKHA